MLGDELLMVKREESFNCNLGHMLQKIMPEWKESILIEETDTFVESASKHADVLVAHRSISPVAIETSFDKNDADMDAINRLGLHYKRTNEEIQTAISMCVPPKFRQTSNLTRKTKLNYALHQQLPDGTRRRFPEYGFIDGTVPDLAVLVTASSIPQENITEVGDKVATKIIAAANVLGDGVQERHMLNVSKTMYQRSIMSGLRTTCVLWLNALLIQQSLMGTVYAPPKTTEIPSQCLKAWRDIYEINWHAIFEPAIGILEHLSKIAPTQVSRALEQLLIAVEDIMTSKVGNEINIGSELLPKMADDRKESAAYYTQAATAELLASLTITHDMEDWSDKSLFKRFRIADLTCGTGTLLRMGYRQIRMFHEQTGRKSTDRLYQDAMEHGLVGTDVSPIATHLTATSLAMAGTWKYGETNIGWVGVGNKNRTGSIEYLAAASITDLFGDAAGVSSGKDTQNKHTSVSIPDSSMNVILMNPPYSRTRGGQSAFNIAGLTDKERKSCQDRWGKLIANEPCTKTPGMAPTFLCLARKKVKPGGRIGFVLPRTAAFADSWEVTRNMIEQDFEDITAVVVAEKALGKNAFSADTHMEEMLLIATRKKDSNTDVSPIKCVTLYDPVTRIGEAAEIAKAIRYTKTGPVKVGVEIGVSRTFYAEGGRPWSHLGVVHNDMATITDNMAGGTLLDIEGTVLGSIRMTRIGDLFAVGNTHHLIGHINGNESIGAFTFHEVINDADAVGTYRSLWRADKDTQRSLVVLPTHKGTPVVGRKAKVNAMWENRSTLFCARGMRWTSQAILAASTPCNVMGGRAWLGLAHDDSRVLKAFALWANSIYGMLVYWSRGQRTQTGRSTMQVKAIIKMPCPKFDEFDNEKLDAAVIEFDRLGKMTLQPAYRASEDDVRGMINEAVSAMLGIPEYDTDTLTSLWCKEPSVHGSKQS